MKTKTNNSNEDKSIFTIRQRRTIIITTLAVSIILVVAGFIVPPPGVIDSSVLTAIGEISGFTALITGFETNFGIKGFKNKNNNDEE